MADDVWTPLRHELDRWHEADKVADLWLRDDDAVEPTPALARLVEATGRHAMPLTLAVIPAHASQSLADGLKDEPNVAVAIHGWSHVNHAGADEKKQELGAQRPADVVLAELDDGLQRLRTLFGRQLTPVLVPPWNRIAPDLLPSLTGLGFQALSVFGREKPAPLPMVNTHVDLIDWHGTRGGREPAVLVAEIVARLAVTFHAGGTMGLLTHHLVHDAAASDFLDTVFALTADHPGCRWRALADMLPEQFQTTDIEHLPFPG
jgi:peptidoglycan/xylan/chitin deacetylase (PgdA/CDA1 family)